MSEENRLLEAFVEISGRDAGLRKALDKAERDVRQSMGKMEGHIRKYADSMRQLGSASGVAVAGALVVDSGFTEEKAGKKARKAGAHSHRHNSESLAARRSFDAGEKRIALWEDALVKLIEAARGRVASELRAAEFEEEEKLRQAKQMYGVSSLQGIAQKAFLSGAKTALNPSPMRKSDSQTQVANLVQEALRHVSDSNALVANIDKVLERYLVFGSVPGMGAF